MLFITDLYKIDKKITKSTYISAQRCIYQSSSTGYVAICLGFLWGFDGNCEGVYKR